MLIDRQKSSGLTYYGYVFLASLLPTLCPAQPASEDSATTLINRNNTLRLTASQLTYNIHSDRVKAHVVHDPNNHWNITDFASGARHYRELLEQPASKIESRGTTYWLVVEIDNQQEKSNWRLKFQHSRTDLIDILTIPQGPNGTHQVHRGGMQTSPDDREIAGLGYTFGLKLAPYESSVIIMRINSYLYEGGLYVRLEEANYNSKTSFAYQVWVLSCLGLLLGLTIYNIFIFLITRDISYFWYSFFAVSLTLTWISYYGLLWSIFDWKDHHRGIATYSQTGVLLFALLFTRAFLNLKQMSSFLNYAFLVGITVLTTIAVAVIFVHPSYIYDAYWIIMLPCTVLVLSASVIGILNGYRPARFLIGGHAIVTFGIFETGLAYLGILPYEDPQPHRFTAMGAAEMALLSMALADRINQLRNEKQVAEEANQLKSSFLALISHEIRTPLNGLLSMVKLLAKSKLDKSQKSYIKAMNYSGNILLSMLNDLLDYSKIEAKNVELEHINFNLKPLIEGLVTLMSAGASEKGLPLSADIDEQLPPQLVGDPNRLHQILINLIGNSIKFTNSGFINVHVYEVERNPKMVTVKFEVEDSGIGIAADDQAEVFNVFTQADASITRRFGGTGLGLSICKQLVEMMSGELGVKSQVGVGSTFYFTLTLPYKTHLAEYTDEKSAAATQAPLRLLLVDDVELNRVAAAGLLRHEGHQITVAKSAKEALAKIQHNDYDLVLMDIHMPDMDGLTATHAIRQLSNPEKAKIPVIALTANASVEQREQYLTAGIDDVASKPLNVEELLASIDKLSAAKSDKSPPVASQNIAPFV